MKLIKPYIEVLDQEEGVEGVYKMIERAGRTCYKSEFNITSDSAKGFVDRMIKSEHYSMLEHGTVYLQRDSIKEDNLEWAEKYLYNPYSRVSYGDGSHRIDSILHNTVYITTNLRVIIEGEWLEDLQYLCEPTQYHERRATVKFVCDRGIWNEFIRHRTLQRVDDCEFLLVDCDAETKFSFAQESTRYCDYSKNKFNNSCTFIIPSWLDLEELYIDTSNTYGISRHIAFISPLCRAERAYFNLLTQGWTPQQARNVLPNALKTELVMTGFISDWVHFLNLRYKGTTGAPHPDAKVLAGQVREEFIKRGYIES